MKHLFSPYEIRGLELKNRIVMPALASFLIEADGGITPKTVEHYRRRASGGVAMVMVEACAVSPLGIVSYHQARLYDDRFIEGISSIVEAIKAEGARAALQIHHGGRQTSPKVIHEKPVAPSALPCPTIRTEVRALSKGEIQELVCQFADAAERAKEAGVELIEIHGAHGYLINQFLSAFSNIRQDEYGGTLYNRARFAIEIVREIRERLGPGFPLSFKISAQEFVEKGLTVEESIQIARWLFDAGIDILQVSAGNDATPEWISQPMLIERGCLVDSAERIKKALKVPVMAVGRINDPLLADAVIAKGKADLICMGRALLADPRLPVKAREGKIDEIRRCIACNTCMNSIFKRGRVECLVNPELGREEELKITPATRRKRVMVIGAGPAGSEAAWVAAMRGHEVILFEKEKEPGGQLAWGAIPSHKKELTNILKFQRHQMERYGVECHFGEEATLEKVKEYRPDVVVVATGARPISPALKGAEEARFLTMVQALDGATPIKQRVLVVGGGSGGCEIAIHLARLGCEVTIMEMLDRIGMQFEAMTRKMVFGQIKQHGIRVLTRARFREMRGAKVLYENSKGELLSLEVDKVVLAMGSRPHDPLSKELAENGFKVFRIGDCLEVRSAKEAIYEGAVIGRRI